MLEITVTRRVRTIDKNRFRILVKVILDEIALKRNLE